MKNRMEPASFRLTGEQRDYLLMVRDHLRNKTMGVNDVLATNEDIIEWISDIIGSGQYEEFDQDWLNDLKYLQPNKNLYGNNDQI